MTRPFVSIAIAAFLNGALLGLLLETTGLFNAVRIGIAVWAGWLIITASSGNKSLWFAAAGGVLVMAIDHLFLSSVAMTGAYLLGLSSFNDSQLQMALWGVVISFIMFSPIAALLGICGGLISRRKIRHAV